QRCVSVKARNKFSSGFRSERSEQGPEETSLRACYASKGPLSSSCNKHLLVALQEWLCLNKKPAQLVAEQAITNHKSLCAIYRMRVSLVGFFRWLVPGRQ